MMSPLPWIEIVTSLFVGFTLGICQLLMDKCTLLKDCITDKGELEMSVIANRQNVNQLIEENSELKKQILELESNLKGLKETHESVKKYNNELALEIKKLTK